MLSTIHYTFLSQLSPDHLPHPELLGDFTFSYYALCQQMDVLSQLHTTRFLTLFWAHIADTIRFT